MKKSKKIVWTIIVVVIGSIASQIIAEQVGAGQYIALGVVALASHKRLIEDAPLA